MQYSTVFLAAFAASGVIAAPTSSSPLIRVQLSDGQEETQTISVIGTNNLRGRLPTIAWKFVSFKEGDIRCQLIGADGEPIGVTRAGTSDITFGKGNAWTIEDDKLIKSITCDPSFKKGAVAAPEVEAITVRLDGAQEESVSVEVEGTLAIVTTTAKKEWVGVKINTDTQTRCQALDKKGNPITVLRGKSVDTTFANGDAWTFKTPSLVSKIICDPKFQKAVPAPQTVKGDTEVVAN